jgi:hypothetical protein
MGSRGNFGCSPHSVEVENNRQDVIYPPNLKADGHNRGAGISNDGAPVDWPTAASLNIYMGTK